MLQTIYIKNVALIKNLTIDFDNGLNILLGETGAGKSIIFDALNFVLGAKADKTLIRSGENEMRVDAVFSMLNSSSISQLREFGVEEEELALSRTLSIDGKSSIRINGMPSSLAVLKEIGKILVDSYSQHEGVELLNNKMHIVMLDKFGKDEIKEKKEQVKTLYNQLKEIEEKIESLGGDDESRERTKSIYEFQINEIEQADLKEGEDEEIRDRLKFLSNAEKIHEGISLCEEYLFDSNSSCISALQQATSSLSSISGFDNISDCVNRLTSAKYEIEDIYETLKTIEDSAEFDEKEFDKLDRRNDLIRSLTKKYGGSIPKVLEFLATAKDNLANLNDSEYLLSKYQTEREEINKKFEVACENLSNQRKETAKIIEQKIVDQLKELGMKSTQFKVNFELQQPSANGIDKVEFAFSANKGQEVKSLSKTASGGELSRFMLAVKNIFAEVGSAQTLVFDEIDSGISGETGNIVGQKLSNITNFAQVLCITHLPQVACYGDSFYFVSKTEDESSTMTQVEKIQGDKVLKSLARMIVGNDVTDLAISQVKELREKAKKN